MIGWREAHSRTADGLRLFHRDYDVAPPGQAPLLCLPGLTRTARDFGALAARHAPRRRVIAPDMRGRGRSDRAPDPAAYAVAVEAADVLALLDHLGVERVVAVGTSRGGLIAMALAAMRPGLLAGVVMNDVGPVIEAEGLAGLMRGLEATPAAFADWPEAEAALRSRLAPTFPGLTPADWAAFARRSFAERDGRPVADWDPALVAVSAAALAQPLPDLWPLFGALSGVPVLALRGALSDILSHATLQAMTQAHPDLTAVTVPDRGHAPFLDEPAATAAIDAFLERIDAA
jgi:pimeloyl-ACP methyl ester carboxylesterase